MAFTKIAETPLYKNDRVTHKVEIYLDDPAPPSLKIIKTTGDYKITRGNSNPSHKYQTIINANVSIDIVDENEWLKNIIETHQDHEFKIIVYRDGYPFFKGLITTNRSKNKFLNDLNVLNVKGYDGFARLKSFTDFSFLPTGKIKLSELCRLILNKLNLENNLYFIMGAYPTTIVTPIKPADFIGIDVEEWLIVNKDVTLYDLLTEALSNSGLQLHSERDLFYLRQIVFCEDATAYFQNVNWSTGSQTYGTANFTVTRSLSDIQKDPVKYSLNPIDEIIFEYGIKNDIDTQFLDRRKYLFWKNPNFKQGLTGWSVSGGSVTVMKDSIQISPSATVLQTSGAIANGKEFDLSFSFNGIRYMTNGGHEISDVDLVEVIAIPPTGEWMYWNFNSNIWQTGSAPGYHRYQFSWLAELAIYPLGGLPKAGYVNKYYLKTIEEKISLTYPTFSAGYGTIRVILFGCATPAFNYPFEISSQFNYCVVKLKEDAGRQQTAPNNLQINCKNSAPKYSQKINCTFHDNDPYLRLSFYDINNSFNLPGSAGVDYEETIQWTPGSKALVQILSERIIDFDAEQIKAFDLKFNNKASAFTEFHELPKMNLDGKGESVYLPVYEERLLMSNTARFILIEHKRKSITKTFRAEYFFNNQ